ncbi:T-cell activation Rho GTPase-activating protein-like [Columba livia]|uniref:T-cell activation Rho GTPase-activating protein-like n=1 Tax=Columba livia TaxID=8932 RepID=UPI0031BA8F95
MTALNLAICVGPNLLGPPEEDTLPLDVLAQVTGKVTQLVEFLVNHHEELFEDEEDEKEEEEEEVLFMEKEEEGQEKEEGAGLAGEGAEESPAPGEQGETAEVCEVHKQHERMPLPSEGGIAAVGTRKFIHQPAALQKCRVRLMQVGHHSLCSDPSRSGTAGLSKAIQAICLLELSWKTGRCHLLRFHCRCLQSLQKAQPRTAPLGRAGNLS